MKKKILYSFSSLIILFVCLYANLNVFKFLSILSPFNEEGLLRKVFRDIIYLLFIQGIIAYFLSSSIFFFNRKIKGFNTLLFFVASFFAYLISSFFVSVMDFNNLSLYKNIEPKWCDDNLVACSAIYNSDAYLKLIFKFAFVSFSQCLYLNIFYKNKLTYSFINIFIIPGSIIIVEMIRIFLFMSYFYDKHILALILNITSFTIQYILYFILNYISIKILKTKNRG